MWLETRIPPAPYLFITTEEILSHRLQPLQSQGFTHLVSNVKGGPCHLLYADDILLFVRTSSTNLQALQNLLANYQVSACQTINLLKSQLFIGKCSNRKKKKRKISSIFSIAESIGTLKYLGIPLVFGTPIRLHFLPLLDTINSKLFAWKA